MLIKSTEQYRAACEELAILCEKRATGRFHEADQMRFESLADAVSMWEEDPIIFGARREVETGVHA